MNSEEIWKDILGYEGLYQVSSYGRVRSLDRYVVDSLENRRFYKGRLLSPVKDKDGYLNVGLSLGNKEKKYKVHRLVAEAFIPNPYNLPQVNHRDEDKTNNMVDNIEFCTAKYNSNYGSRKDRVRDTAIKNGSWSPLSKEEYRKKYYQENKEHRKKYYQENKEHRKKYYQEKKDHIKEYYKKYYQEHKNEYNERQKEYSQKNKEKIREYHHQYYLKKKEENIQNNV